jgi:hypothetical protein
MLLPEKNIGVALPSFHWRSFAVSGGRGEDQGPIAPIAAPRRGTEMFDSSAQIGQAKANCDRT